MSGPAIVGFPRDYRVLAIGLRSATALFFGVAGAALLAIAYLAVRFLAGEDVAAMFFRSWGVIWLAGGLLIGIVAVWKKVVPLRWLAARFLPMASVVETPAQARSEVKRQIRAGVDFVKPYDYLDRRTYFAALQTARQAGIYSLGHIPEDPEVVHVKEALEAGLNELAHVDELTHEFLIDYDPSIRRWVEWELETEKVDEIAQTVAEHDAAVTATLVTNETVLLGLEDMDALLQRPEYQRIKSDKIEKWKVGGRMVKWQGQEEYRRNRLRPLWMDLTASLHRAGVPVLVGTDSDVEGIVPGFSEHRELELLVEAGFTPFEALAAGTRDAAKIAERMMAESNWGTIEVGNRADLILLSKNPLTDIRNSSSIYGVVLRGRWLTAQDLKQAVSDYLGGVQ
jgi:imidazolonepropionase-like amidohydrolase